MQAVPLIPKSTAGCSHDEARGPGRGTRSETSSGPVLIRDLGQLLHPWVLRVGPYKGLREVREKVGGVMAEAEV